MYAHSCNLSWQELSQKARQHFHYPPFNQGAGCVVHLLLDAENACSDFHWNQLLFQLFGMPYYTHICKWPYMYLHGYVEDSSMLAVFLNYSARSLPHWTWRSLIQQPARIMSSRDLAVSACPDLELQTCTSSPSIYITGILGDWTHACVTSPLWIEPSPALLVIFMNMLTV